MSCSVDGCGRRVAGRGWCSSHYRLWRAGKPLDTPIRGYQRYEVGPDGKVAPVPTQPSVAPSRRREPPFAREHALLRSLGLR
jgi:hypothetical protein